MQPGTDWKLGKLLRSGFAILNDEALIASLSPSGAAALSFLGSNLDLSLYNAGFERYQRTCRGALFNCAVG